jgi:hypothetical protein
MKRYLLLPLTGLFTVLFAAAAMAVPFSEQGWKTQDQHIHVEGDVPMLQTVSSPTTLHLTVLLHNNPSIFHVNFLDLQDQGTEIAKVPLNVFGQNSLSQSFPVDVTLDPNKFAHSGWQELRIRANIDKPDREFPTSRVCVNIQNGKSVSNYCGGPTVAGRCGSGAWYPDIPSNYRIVFVDCRDVNKAIHGTYAAGDKIRVKFQDGAGYVSVDPDFHHGNPGIVIGSNMAPNKWLTVTVPSGLAPGAHKLHLRSQTGVEAGAYVMTFNVA